MKAPLPSVIFLGGLLFAVNFTYGQIWTQTTASNLNWYSVASSADGTKLAAVAQQIPVSGAPPGGMYLSTNSGSTWAESGPSNLMGSAVASSADGATLAAITQSEILVSTNSGNTWTIINALYHFRGGGNIAISADGSRLVADAQGGGGIYVSTNSGATWKLAITNTVGGVGPYWGPVTCSADGTKLAVEENGSSDPKLITSTNAGSTWRLSFSGFAHWYGLATTADGSKLFLLGYASNPIYSTCLCVSTNWGATWSTNLVSFSGDSVLACSADGSKLVTLGNGGSSIYTSTNSGLTWTSNSAPNEYYISVASSADGNKLVAVSEPLLGTPSVGGIWVSQSVPTPQLKLASSSNEMAFSWIAPSTNFVLQENSDLTASNWVSLTNTPTLNLSNLNDEVVLSPTNRSDFFRLMSR